MDGLFKLVAFKKGSAKMMDTPYYCVLRTLGIAFKKSFAKVTRGFAP